MSSHDEEESIGITSIAENDKGKDSSEDYQIADEPSFTYKQHTATILSLTGPIVLSEIFQNILPIVDIAFVGNLGKDELGAAALATVWFNLWNTVMLGLMTATDTMLSQSFGAKEYRGFAMWTVNSIVVVTVVGIFVAGLIALCEPCMLLFGQDPDLAKNAGDFSYRLIPGLIPYFIFKVLTKYLQAQNIVTPAVYIGILANAVNVFANWFFIYGLNLGLNGAPWATTLTRIGEMILIILYIRWQSTTTLADTFPVMSARNLEMEVMMPFLKLGLSGALAFACEAWSFEVTTILAGLLGTISLDAHIIALSITTFTYLSFAFAVGLSASLRVGQLIGEGLPGDAKRSSVVSYVINISLQVILAAIIFPCQDIIGELFSENEEVQELVSKLIPIACLFMVGDAIQANSGGIMRGLGRQSLVLKMNIVGFWIFAIPIGSVLTFVADMGVFGIWWGFVTGIYLATAIGVYIIFRINWRGEALNATIRVSSQM